MNKLTSKDSSYAFLFGFLACQASVVFFTIFGLIICSIFKIETTQFELFLNQSYGYLLGVLAMDAGLLLTFLFINKNKDNKIISKPNTKRILLYTLIAVASFFCLYPLIVCIDSLLIKLNIPLNSIPYTLDTKGYFISIVSLVILPAVCEELLFRGLIFKGLKKHGKAFAIMITSVMFAIFHMSISQTVYPILFGLLLSVIMFYENNILYTILVHLINNFLSLTLSYFNISLVFNHWSYILLATTLACIFIAFVLYFTIKNNKENEKQPLNKAEKIVLACCLAIMIIFWIITFLTSIL
ncbi:MAG: CPBP family intramembrane metalloprotease [Clostridia bacterium]|nr:CPBP family intramembrane metalloprotease [Clostridia bacterium]